MKTNVTVEYAGNQYEENDIIAGGKKIKDIKSLHIYIKPEETAAYYVINGEASGCVTL